MRRTSSYLAWVRRIVAGSPGYLSLIALSACLNSDVGATVTTAQYCRDDAAISCDKFFNCYSNSMRQAEQDSRKQIWTDRGDCVAKLSAGCDSKYVCPMPDQIFQDMKAAACLTAERALTCAEWLTVPPIIPAACKICNPASGECTPSICTDREL